MTTLRSATRGLRAAFVLLTRFPVGGHPFSTEEWRWASVAYPLVGAIIGLILSVVWWIAGPLGPLAAALVVYTISLLITGALHEDGLADTADALGGTHTRDKLFAILKDSRVGTYGALALIMSIGLRVALLARLADAGPTGLIVSHALARLGPVWLMALLPYVTPEGSRSRHVVQAGSVPVGMATVVGAAVLVAVALVGRLTLAEASGVVLGLATVIVISAWTFRSRAGGITGDFLGAAEQMGEVVVLAGLVLL